MILVRVTRTHPNMNDREPKLLDWLGIHLSYLVDLRGLS